ncbi:MAG: ImmA/IrrE family metallo-endopeptidase [Chitinispirillales bacterium]|jgi:hypothetical protein|nr:ImmA/IrrE family metallo-endopeptidase [Chitinispirillales bacterium]
MNSKVQKLSKKAVREAAEAFSLQYNEHGALPFPIEEVIEYGIGIDIVPMHGLRSKFNSDAFTLGDFKEIRIDDKLYTELPGRYRFTLAHEVGHIVLHREILERQMLRSVEEWAEFHKSMGNAEHRELENQADFFANFLLMPEEQFKYILQEKLPEIEEYVSGLKKLKTTKIEPSRIFDSAVNRIARVVVKTFDVSITAAENKVKYAPEFNRIKLLIWK